MEVILTAIGAINALMLFVLSDVRSRVARLEDHLMQVPKGTK